MRRFLVFCWTFFAVAFATGIAATDASAGTVLVVGDSISAAYGMPPDKGWVKLLENRSDEQGMPQRVVNASVSGDTTSGGLSRLPSLLRQHKPALVIIGLGGNDGLRGLPLKTTRGNLTEMVKLARRAGAKVVLLGMDIPPNYGPKYTREFREIYPAIAKAQGVALVPSFVAKVGTDPQMMQSDGIHPNQWAQPVLLDAVWKVAGPLLEAIDK